MPESSPRHCRIACLLIDGFALMSYASVVEPLRAANWLAGQTIYSIEQIPAEGDVAQSSTGAQIPATISLDALSRETADELDIVFVIAGGNPASFQNPQVFKILRQLSQRGITLGGVSGGPVILAAAGLMPGRRMTVHWEHLDLLRESNPDLLIERSLYIMDRDRITCAGGVAPLDMMHALITQHHNANFAQQVSDWFLHTEVRPASGPQRADLIKRHGTTNPNILQAIEIMRNHIADPLTLTQIAQRTSISSRQLNRLFQQKLGCNTMRFYRQLRLRKARGLLTYSSLPITEIALATGFTSSAHFSSSFRQEFDCSPSSTRTRKNV